MSDILPQERQAGIVRLTLTDPKTRNSLSEAMMAELVLALDDLRRDDTARVIVIAAEGPAFCSGHNLKEITAHRQDGDRGAAYFTKLMAQCATLMQAIVHHPLPVIAEIQAVASAAGCQLVASCDLAVAAEPTRFATPGVNIGPLLLDTDGRPVAQRGAQTCDGDAAHRRSDRCRGSPAHRPHQPHRT